MSANRRLSVLVAGADVDFNALVGRALDDAGHRVRVVGRGSAAVTACERARPDLVILDVELPDLSGLDVCRMLRAQPATATLPILVLSGRSGDADRVAGLEAGADDYLVKPITMREMVLRVDALGRRAAQPPPQPAGRIEAGAVRLDIDALLAYVDGEERPLTFIEFQLLRLLVAQPGKALSRKEIRDQVWSGGGKADSRTIDTHIKRLRRKLGRAAAAVETVRGVGYRYRVNR